MPGKSPFPGVMLSQLPPRFVITAELQGIRPWVLLVSMTACGAGGLPPGVAIKFKYFLVRDMTGACPSKALAHSKAHAMAHLITLMVGATTMGNE